MQHKAITNGRLGAIARHLQEALDGERAVADVRQLTTWNRTPGSSGYRAAGEFVVDALRRADLVDVALQSYPMDGHTAHREWATEPAWDVTYAKIQVVAPIKQTLADWHTDPISVYQGSWGTPPEGVRTELVDVGVGISDGDYTNHAVEGRVVLAFGPTQQVYEKAVVQRGALGILSHHMPWQCPEVGRTPEQLPDLVSQGKLLVGLGDERRGFAFSISHRLAGELKKLLEQGPIEVQCQIDGGPHEGAFDVVTGRIPGRENPEKEFIVVAHLCHPSPGANDNASGVALAIEIARCLAAQQVREAGTLLYSVRFLFVPEIIGPLAFLSSGLVAPENLLGGVNLDMVGASQSITKSPILFENTPWSLPTYLFDLGKAFLSLGRPSDRDGLWSYRAVPFEGGSDNIVFNDAPVGAPMVGFGYRADPCYHSNLDVWTNMDPTILENVGLAAGGQIWVAASMDTELADEVLDVVADGRCARKDRWPQAVERAMIESIQRRSPEDLKVGAVVARHLSRLPAGPAPVDEDRFDQAGIFPNGRPTRVVASLVWPPINGSSKFLAKLSPNHMLKRFMSGYDYIRAMRCIYELLNLCDGTRRWSDIVDLVAGQFEGVSQDEVIDLAVVLRDAAALEEKGKSA